MAEGGADRLLTSDAADVPWCRPALLAAELARRGAPVVVVGGSARWMRTGLGDPRDLDVVVTPESVPALVATLNDVGVPARAASLMRCRTVRYQTGWGPLDVFVAQVRPAYGPVVVDGVPVGTAVAP
ncbi:hypothetical protein [Oryzihumus leptocrescens]|uniref:Nucleotidyltransferase-like protein n=1 Tax=Oryzihumus leptocrescens TaxID=297536 RepID=A0A542ZH74_9MICO|nr:hypothetical protein [Oryzihumus leptocrescens]TQL59675.1 hypothetical protein FB474_1039 [Oryzihumus leptocrescens]